MRKAGGRTITCGSPFKPQASHTEPLASFVQEVVVDGNIVSSRKPEDIPVFNIAMIDLFSRMRERAPKAA